MSPGVLDRSLLCMAHPVLDLGEGLFDRIEVGGIGRQEPEPCAGRCDDLTDGRRFVAAEIVHDDNVARLEDRHELLLDIGAEALAIDRPVEDAGRGELVATQCAQECQRAPVTMRGKGAQALALRTPAAQRRHVGLDPGLVDEHQPSGIETSLPCLPALTSAGNVGAGLLKGE